MTKSPPVGMMRNVSPEDVAQVETWWHSLPLNTRSKLRQYYSRTATKEEFSPPEMEGFYVDPEDLAESGDEPIIIG